jgi:exonuclease III
MKLLSWNCQGLGNPKTVRALQKLITQNHPDIIFLMETKLHNITDKFKAKFAASYNIYVIDYILNGERGRSGEILFLWNYCTCHVEIKDVNSNYINALVTNISNQMQWRATGVYGYPQHHNKHLTCELIQNLANNSFNNNWLLFGDFNLILNTNEKYGGNPMDTNTTSLFRDTLNLCGLHDLGYKGDIFTWNNRQEENQLIKARLDRFMANYNWISAFPNYLDLNLTTLLFYLIYPLFLTLYSTISRIGLLDMSRLGPGTKTTTSRSRKPGSTARELLLKSSKLPRPLCTDGGIKDLASFLKESRLFKKT